jgi:N-acetylneuraminic acid mutarotase
MGLEEAIMLLDTLSFFLEPGTLILYNARHTYADVTVTGSLCSEKRSLDGRRIHMKNRVIVLFVAAMLGIPSADVTGRTWTWMSGSNVTNQHGYYGTQGVPEHGNMPGARSVSISWADSSGNLWLFGGDGYAASGISGYMNDLWKFDGENWGWMSGSDTIGQHGVYGSQGVPASGNVPGARQQSISWIGSSDSLWLFGGYGFAASGGSSKLNDLWRFDGANWTWVSGSNLTDQPGVYGTLGVPAPGNTPGARYGSVSFKDGKGRFWLFGGQGYDASGSEGYMNDLWRFNGTNWAWIGGSSTKNQFAVYGSLGVPDPCNRPGARYSGVCWMDESGNLWLFGGFGCTQNTIGYLNDLWKFDGTYWTWVSGSSMTDQHGVYGTKGVPASGNVPGARQYSISWLDQSGNFWLFGGWGFAASGSSGQLNDLWRFDGTDWTWISGSNSTGQHSVYGTRGVPAPGNIPGARQYSISWLDRGGRLWLFGGYGLAASGITGYLNDMWRFGIPDEAADLNVDGVVNYMDLLVLADEWLNDRHPSADFAPQPMGDNRANFLDFAFLANQWMRSM